MKGEEEKPPAPPLRLTSNRGDFTVSLPVDLRPLPKEPEEKIKHSKSKLKKGKEGYEKPNISYPTKFTHVVHVGFDDDTGEFTGLPEAWTRLLVASNISKEMQKKNPQAVLDVLNYYEHSSKRALEDKYMTQTPSTEPSPRPSYSVSTHALSSPSSQLPCPPLLPPHLQPVQPSPTQPEPAAPLSTPPPDSAARRKASSWSRRSCSICC